MTASPLRNNLAGWLNEPTVQDRVLAYMDEVGAPMLLREIYRPLQLSKASVNRVLGRLHAKGFLTRWKIPVERHRPGRPSQAAPRSGATWRCYLYRFAVGEGEDE